MFVVVVARVAGSAAQCSVVEAYCLCAAGCSYACESRLHARKRKCIVVSESRLFVARGSDVTRRHLVCVHARMSLRSRPHHAVESVSSSPQATLDSSFLESFTYHEHRHVSIHIYVVSYDSGESKRCSEYS